MHSSFFAILALAFTCLIATVSADDTWYAVFTNSSGYSFLDSNGAVIQGGSAGSVADVDASKDKGMRFRFPAGDGGIVVNSAHDDHAVGYDSSKNEFHADFATSHTDDLVKVSINPNGSQVTMCNGKSCIGAGGAKTTDQFIWWIEQVGEA